MRLRLLLLLLVSLATAGLMAAAPAAAWDRVTVAPMKTSIYVGSVTLTTTVFERSGTTLASTYDAQVFPWFFWGETGRITINLGEGDLVRLAKGETVEFTGDASNQKHKPRSITGRAQPAGPNSGKMKVRIMADGIELIFNGSYELNGV